MKTKKWLFAVDSNSSVPAELTDAARANAQRTWLCPGCALPRIDSEFGDIVVKHGVADLALNFVRATGIGIIREDFVDILKGSDALENLSFKDVSSSAGSIKGFYAFRPKEVMIIRGGPKSGCRHCEICNRIIYFPIGKWHLVDKALKRGNATIFGDQFDGMIVHESISNVVKSMKWKSLNVTKLPVFDISLDNLDI